MTDKFAVIDTETNWNDGVMSIGVVVVDLLPMEKRILYITLLTWHTGKAEMWIWC